MTLTIKLSSQEEAYLTTLAHRTGMDLTDLARTLITSPIPIGSGRKQRERQHLYYTASEAEFNCALDDIAALNENLPALPSEAYERESIYGDY